MEDLTAWLRAQLDEDERVAREVLELESDDFEYAYSWSRYSRLKANGIGGNMSVPGAPTPRERLAEVDAKRRILELCASHADAQFPDSYGGYASAMEDAVHILALPYADRPGYREEWRPTG